MRNESHKSLIGMVRDHVIAWRKAEGWSRETVVQAIVEAHQRIDGPTASGIVFDPTTRDAFERQKVNADRVFRWLDDESKDSNLLPANFLPSILAAMPLDVRLHCLSDFLRPLGVTVSSVDMAVDSSFEASVHLRSLIKETSEAQLALVEVGPDAGVAQLERASREIKDVQEVAGRAARALEAAMSGIRAGVAKVTSLRGSDK
ncbi:toxin YdaT family protein [Pseudoduganella rivuli]|uniref:toxin YdaT family protein n=1 Tax=Pseudoduganella rivuli TaxID=2666085 RepID=UPI0018A21FE1|nr:toxin YdaT family protein [Pseudoduganella rivuli]